MVGLSFAAVPLYRMFCAYTGYRRHAADRRRRECQASSAATITVRFNADTNPNLPWSFAPAQRQVTLPLGDEQVAFYTARTRRARP